MRAPCLVLLLLLAGCAASPSPPVPATDADVLVGDCPLRLPDGTPLACDGQDLVQATTADRPPLTDGWKCTARYTTDGVLLEQYTTAEGRLGFYWDWQRWKEDGLAFQRLALYTGMEQGASHHIAYQPQGFFAMPGTHEPDGRVEIHETVRLLRVHARLDGQWVQDPANVTFLLDSVGADTWWAVRFDWPGGPYFVDTMHEDVEEGQLGKWQGGGWRGTIAGTDVIIDSVGKGIKYPDADFARQRAWVDRCTAPLAVP